MEKGHPRGENSIKNADFWIIYVHHPSRHKRLCVLKTKLSVGDFRCFGLNLSSRNTRDVRGGVWGWRHGQILEERMYLNLKLNVIIHFHSPTTHADTSNSTVESWWWVEDVFAPFLLSLASKNTKDALGRNWGWRHGELLEKLMYLTLVTFDIAHFYHTNRCEW